jgi:hypothetical protein
MQIRKKPVEVEAERIDQPQTIATMEGSYEVTEAMVEEGYYVITGVEGERYPIKAATLLETYDPAGELAEEEFETLRSEVRG